MNVSIKTSHALRYAALLLVILLGYLLLVRPDRLTGKVASLPLLSLATPALGLTTPVLSQAPVLSRAPVLGYTTPVLSHTDVVPVLRRADVSRNTGLSEADRYFFERAAKSGGQEDIVSRGALSHLVYPDVREYAYMVLNDHTAANVELKALAARKGVVLPAPEKLTSRRWWKGAGSVDRLYVSLMAEDNEAVVELFEKATQSDDAEVATFARKTLPILQNHLNTARDLKKMTD